MPSFREIRAREKKIDIVKTAAEVFREKGYAGATVEEIASRLMLTKGSIYYYVKNKEDLLFYCHDMAMDLILNKIETIDASEDMPDEKLRNIIKSHIEVLIDELNLITVLLQEEYRLSEEPRRKIIEKRDKLDNIIKKTIREGMEMGIFRKDINPSLVRFIIMGSINWIPHWYRKSGSLTKTEIGDYFADYLVNSLKN